MHIRLATADDADGIATVHVAAWRAAYEALLPVAYLARLDPHSRAEKWRSALLAGAPRVLVAIVNDAIAGWVAFGPARDADLDARCAEIEAIYVASACWNRGIGTALMTAACEMLHVEGYAHIALWVLNDNAAACAFYARRGFARDGFARNIEIGGVSLMEVRLTRDIVI
ncbi:GNAT family N-acetyltransferase [Paraburkholderia sp. Tr-20389]|uniref:GNAT family N-acetyltransferase n=1 Tax=Paraburkholderia sp. Tr-20389 TaxID=2703903 RepID=UPI00197FABC3|nr:GNAT family N-acetyltransferase [Paraburkholderia sp. Tr-20389]MBN3752184.1 GNAT family N-acetyltransferase [Paraburkholderia sp. Tr-20389]